MKKNVTNVAGITEEDDGHHGNGEPSLPIGCLLLYTKVNDAIPALESVWDRLLHTRGTARASPEEDPLEPPARVIVLSNGALVIQDAICECFGRDREGLLDGRVRIEFATTTHGAYRTPSSPFTSNTVDGDGGGNNATYGIVHAGLGSTH